jgi:hypothetical protein
LKKAYPRVLANLTRQKKAIVLSNYMSVKYGKFTSPSLTGITETKTDGTSWIYKFLKSGWSYVKELDFDLSDPTVVSSISDRVQNLLYEHASRGIKAAQEEDPLTWC